MMRSRQQSRAKIGTSPSRRIFSISAAPDPCMVLEIPDNLARLGYFLNQAYWFIKNRHVDRPDVVHDTRARLSRLMDEASPDFAAIVTRVMAEMGAI